jgi:hypothetical protein
MLESRSYCKFFFSAFALMLTLFFLKTVVSVCYGKEHFESILYVDPEYGSLESESVYSWINSLYIDENSNVKKINVIEPLPETVLPPDIASVAFSWEDPEPSAAWLLTVSHQERILVNALLDKTWWIPEKTLWNQLKKIAKENKLQVRIKGMGGWNGREILSENITSFSFSEDALDARVLFIRKPLPFSKAKQYPKLTELVVGDVSSYDQPKTVMSNINVCANCHTYSSDGKIFALDVDYGGDKGAFAMAPIRSDMKLDKNNFFSWNKIPAVRPASYNMGLFAQLSPDGRYLAATVSETAVMVTMEDLFFTQLFFPVTGQIAIFDRKTGTYRLLPGASVGTMAQTAPSWSSDGKTIAFSAIPIQPELIQKVLGKEVSNESPKQKIEELNKRYNVQFDIYTVPFNEGRGGKALPLEGASNNGYSNYFPRYSPDGRWIVFTQSPTGFLLQPQSRLCIILTEGGSLRYLKCNMPIMNSWHSWSPNSKWIVFSSKAASPYTELYITHIDNHGESSPAVRLFRFSSKELAALVPELIPLSVKVPQFVSFEP